MKYAYPTLVLETPEPTPNITPARPIAPAVHLRILAGSPMAHLLECARRRTGATPAMLAAAAVHEGLRAAADNPDFLDRLVWWAQQKPLGRQLAPVGI